MTTRRLLCFFFLKDFLIAARLIQDAIDGTDIDFKHNKASLM